MLYPRLVLAKQLLTDDRVIFCSIDDKNQAYIKCLFDDVFGEGNFCSSIVWKKGNAQNDAKTIQANHEYVLCYAKNISLEPIAKIATQEKESVIFDDNNKKYYYLSGSLTTGGEGGILNARPNLGYTIYYNPNTKDIKALVDYDKELAKNSNDESLVYKNNNELINKGYVIIRPDKKGDLLGAWTWSLDSFKANRNNISIINQDDDYIVKKIEWVSSENIKQDKNGKKFTIVTKEHPPKSYVEFSSASGTKTLTKILKSKKFSNPKPMELIKYLLEISSEKDSIVLDFFAGSGTTGHAVMQLNKEDGGKRQFILVTNNEITKTNPNGIAYDVTSKRLKRIMAGSCYDGVNDFKWLKDNKPYQNNLEVYELDSIASNNQEIFSVIDEKLYGEDFKQDIQAKIKWICENFEITCKDLED